MTVTEIIFHVGQDVPLFAFPVDNTGAPANGAATVTVTLPDGTAGSPTAPVNQATGQYASTLATAPQAGTYLVRWSVVGSGFTWVNEDEFTVEAQAGLHVVDAASVRAHLNLDNRVHDDELLGFILSADEQARDACGPFALEQHTQWVTGGRASIGVDWNPIKSVQSVTEYYGLAAFPLTEQPLGAQTSAFAFTVDYETGIITRRTYGGEASIFAWGERNIKVAYTAGLGSIPWSVRLGALELIRHLYQQTQQGRMPRGGRSMDHAEGTPMGFAMPDRVVELWAPFRRAPGIA